MSPIKHMLTTGQPVIVGKEAVMRGRVLLASSEADGARGLMRVWALIETGTLPRIPFGWPRATVPQCPVGLEA